MRTSRGEKERRGDGETVPERRGSVVTGGSSVYIGILAMQPEASLDSNSKHFISEFLRVKLNARSL